MRRPLLRPFEVVFEPKNHRKSTFSVLFSTLSGLFQVCTADSWLIRNPDVGNLSFRPSPKNNERSERPVFCVSWPL